MPVRRLSWCIFPDFASIAMSGAAVPQTSPILIRIPGLSIDLCDRAHGEDKCLEHRPPGRMGKKLPGVVYLQQV